MEGLVAAVSIKIAEPQFSAQTKDKLVTKEALYSVNKVVGDYLSKYFEENPKIAKDVITRTLRAKRAREAAAKARKASLVENMQQVFLLQPNLLIVNPMIQLYVSYIW